MNKRLQLDEMIDDLMKQKDPSELFLSVIDSMKSVSDTMDNTSDKDLLQYHLPELNQDLKGILPYSLVVVGAGTGCGKSEFISNLVYENAKQGKKVVYFDLENDNGDFVRRQTAKKLSIKHHRYIGVDCLYTGDVLNTPLGEDIMDTFSEIEAEIKDNVKIFNNEQIPTFQEFEQHLTALKEEEDFDLICIDHLHYFSMFESSDNQSTQIGKIMRGLRDLSKHGVPIVIASHLNNSNGKEPPGNNNLFGSTNISKEASVVILFHKEGEDTYMRVTKKRHGGQYYEHFGEYDTINREIKFREEFNNQQI